MLLHTKRPVEYTMRNLFVIFVTTLLLLFYIFRHVFTLVPRVSLPPALWSERETLGTR